MSTLEGNKVRIIGYDKSVEMCHSNNKFENRRTIKNEPSIKNTSVEKEEKIQLIIIQKNLHYYSKY